MKISTVIPTHKRPELLKRAIDSVLNQTLPADEIVVVDDASCNVTRKLVEGYQLSSLLYVQNVDGQGASSSRNLGVAKASGDYIAFLDDDDIFFPTKLKKVSDFIISNSVDLVYHPAKIDMVNENVFYYTKPKYFEEQAILKKEMAISNIVGGTPMVVVKKESFDSAGGFDEGLQALEDYELWLRMAINNCTFKKLDCPLTNYFYKTKVESVSKNIDVNLHALKQIESKHHAIYSLLEPSEVKRHVLWCDRMLVHKLLLNGQVFNAFRAQLSVIKNNLNLKELVLLCSICLGAKFVFKMKARFG